MKVYFISGMAADERAFNHIVLPPGHEIIHIKWLTPNKDETLKEYAIRMATPIINTEPFTIIGLSMGGMIAVEIGKMYKAYKIILISSVPHPQHLPPYFRWAAAVKLHHVFSANAFKLGAYMKRFFTNENVADKKYLREMIRKSDPAFINWAINAILTWEDSSKQSCDYIHIHGSSDLLLPAKFTKPTHIIEGGGHMMILTHANQVNKILREIIE